MKYGFSDEDWIRYQKKHRIWQESLKTYTCIPLWDREPPGYNRDYQQEIPRLCVLPIQKSARGIILVCAGGGFKNKAVSEGKLVAEKYHEYGFNTAILDYRCRPYDISVSVTDACRAIDLLHDYCHTWGVKSGKTAVCGFSAGGALAVLAAAAVNERKLFPGKVDALILGYPVTGCKTMRLLFDGTDLGDREIAKNTPDRQELGRLPPVCMWMTGEDEFIPGKEFFAFAEKLMHEGVPCELHVFPKGKHGIGLADGTSDTGEKNGHTARWMPLSCEWLTEMGF